MPKLMRDYGAPWSGYDGARERHLADAGSFTEDSFDFEFDPVQMAFLRRPGSTNVAGITSFDADVGASALGLLEIGYMTGTIAAEDTLAGADARDIRMRALQGLALKLPSADAATYPLSAESYGFLFGDLRHDEYRYGQFYYRLKPSNGAAEQNRVIADGMAVTTTTAGRIQHNDYPELLKLFPEIGGGRFVSTYDRARHANGSQSCVALGGHVIFGAYDGVPHKWNKVTAGHRGITDIERVSPVGQVPAMGVITVTLPSVNRAGSWQSGDMFFLGIVGERRDGSRTAPTPVRAPNVRFPAVHNSGSRRRTTVGGYGLVMLDDGTTSAGSGTTDYNGATNGRYSYITLSGLPVFESDDFVRRHIVRSPKVNGHLEGALPNSADLRIALTIENNTDTSCVLESGLDADLAADESVVRYGQRMMPRARHLWHAGGRVFAGNTRINPLAMILAPRLIGASTEADPATAYTPNDVNVCSSWETDSMDNENGVSLYRFYFSLSATVLTLYKKDSNSAQNPIPNTVFTLSNYASIQDLVDAINAHGTGLATSSATDNSGGAGAWMACVAPGADGNSPPTKMKATRTGENAATTGSYGDRVKYNSNASEFVDLQRAYGQCWYGYTLFTDAYLAQFGEQERGIWYTGAGFGHPRNSANNWFDDPLEDFYREGPESAGRLMGGKALGDDSVVAFANGIYKMTNTTDGNSGEDRDMRLEVINESRGCICSWSLASGPGWVGYLTREGYVIYSQGREWLISAPKVYNPADKRGPWAYEIAQCEAAAGSGEAADGLFYAQAIGSLLVVNYRSDAASGATDDYPDAQMIYDMSRGNSANIGTAVVDPKTGEPWGWSTPLSLRVSACVLVQGAAGGEVFGAVDKLTNNTGSLTKFFGRVDQFRTGNYDRQETVLVTFCQTENAEARVYNAVNDLDRIPIGATMTFGGTVSVTDVPHPKIFTVAACTLAAFVLTTTTDFGFEHLGVDDLVIQGTTLMVVTATVDDETVTVAVLSGPVTFTSQTVTVPAQVSTSIAATSTVAASSCTFQGRNVVADGYTLTDIPDPTRRHFARKVTPVYLKLDDGLRVAYTRFRDGPRNSDVGWYELRLPACASDESFKAKPLNLPLPARSPGEAIELRIRDIGKGSAGKIWSVRVEGGQLNTRST